MAFTGSFYEGWQTIAIAAAAIAVIVSSMLIMLSRLFGLRQLEQTAKTEFVYAASTVFIVILVEGLIFAAEPILAGGGASLARSMYLSTLQCSGAPVTFGQNTLIDWMLLYLATPTGCVQSFMDVLYALSIPVEAIASIFMEIFMSEHASGFGVKPIAERITNTTQSLSFYMYMYYLLVHILNFIKYYGGFFFSIGVALRAFPPTRGTGAYLMAVSFGLYFIFPLSYILIATVSLPQMQSEMIIAGTVAPDGSVLQGCSQNPTGGIALACVLPQVTDPKEYSCGGATTGRMLEYVDRFKDNAFGLEDMLTFRVIDLGRHLVSAICIFPMIALVILLTFVLNTTNLFGGNIPEIGRGLVKLI